MENSHRYDICNIDVRRASFAKLLRSEKHLEKKDSMIYLYQYGYLKKSKNLFGKK